MTVGDLARVVCSLHTDPPYLISLMQQCLEKLSVFPLCTVSFVGSLYIKTVKCFLIL